MSVAAAEAAADAILRLDCEFKREREEQKTAEWLAACWQDAAIAVGARNAALRSCAADLKRLGVDAPLPPTNGMSGSNLGDLRVWCEQTDKCLAVAREQVIEAKIRRTTEVIRREVPRTPLPTMDDWIRTYGRTVLTPEMISVAPPSPAPADSSAVAKKIDSLLADLRRDVPQPAFAKIMVQAGRAAEASSIHQARTHTAQLAALVREANEAAASHAADVEFANTHLNLFEMKAVVDSLTEDDLAVVDALRAAIDGNPLDELRKEAAQALRLRAIEVAKRALIRERAVAILTDMGCRVDADAGESSAGLDVLRVSHDQLGKASATVTVGADSLAYGLRPEHQARVDQDLAAERQACGFLNLTMNEAVRRIRLDGGQLDTVTEEKPEDLKLKLDAIPSDRRRRVEPNERERNL
jgi:hypothetical protein